MPEYRVSWTIDVSADSPEEAAKEALKIQRDPESIAVMFKVCERGRAKLFGTTFVDLMEGNYGSKQISSSILKKL